MGRRSINTTKSGKYMNPTDQARKEARKRELKKNKKQRQMVRAAVLKGKDPTQIIMEMEKMDIMEYDVECQPTLSEKVLKDKRKKLKETFDRVMKMYEKENPEYWVELRRMETDYEKKRQTRIEYYEAVRHAQAVTVDEIPLPNLDMPFNTQAVPSALISDEEPALQNTTNIPHSILKKSHIPSAAERLKPPGCPPMPVPDLSDYDEEVEYNPLADEALPHLAELSALKSVHFADQNMSDVNIGGKDKLKMSGQDIDDFMRESEVLFNEKFNEKLGNPQMRNENRPEDLLKGPRPLDLMGDQIPREIPGGLEPHHGPDGPDFPRPKDLMSDPMQIRPVGPQGLGPGLPSHILPPALRGHVIPGTRLPLGPPPQGLPHVIPPPLSLRPPLRPLMAPGALPPGLLPRNVAPLNNPNVLSAKPQLIVRPRNADGHSATIEAKPQIRCLSADVTRFLPTSLRVKREDKKKSKQANDGKEGNNTKIEEIEKKPTKDDAYSQFMQEMEGLL